MELFALGIVVGVALSALMAAVLVLLHKPIIQVMGPVAKKIELAGPRPRGFVIEPQSEADEVRAQRIRDNAERGEDTPLSELMDEE